MKNVIYEKGYLSTMWMWMNSIALNIYIEEFSVGYIYIYIYS